MHWLGVLSLFLATLTISVAQNRENGILYDHIAYQLRTWSPQLVRSNNFPLPAPHLLVQTWRYVGVQHPGQITAFQIICSKISVAKLPGRDDCGEYKLTFTDGNNVQDFCGDVAPFKILSETNDITLEFHTGPNGGGLVNCTVEALPLTSDRNVITTTTTTTPKPTEPAFLTQESYEVDSSEHGGEAGAKGTTCSCGWANKVSSRVVNGTETNRNEFPFAAGLAIRGTRDRFCAGTIITRNHVLTAAHCTTGLPSYSLSVIVGIHNMETDQIGPNNEIPVENILQHSEFEYNIFLHDISLLVLEREIKFNQLVGPACLPPPSPRLDLERQYIKIIGWGSTFFRGPQSPVLQKVDVRVVPSKECHQKYSQIDVENPTRLCTYAKRKASCQGDSGGPVMWVDPETNRYTHVGIVSFGRICGDDSPSVHTRVQAHLHWIYQNIRASNKPNSQTCSKIN